MARLSRGVYRACAACRDGLALFVEKRCMVRRAAAAPKSWPVSAAAVGAVIDSVAGGIRDTKPRGRPYRFSRDARPSPGTGSFRR